MGLPSHFDIRRGAAGIRRELGQDLVEFALILPILLGLTFGIIEFGRAFFTYNTIVNAAREGARYGSLDPNPTRTETAALRLATGIRCENGRLVGAPAVTVTSPSGAIDVEVVCELRLITGWIPKVLGGTDTITLRAQSEMRLE